MKETRELFGTIFFSYLSTVSVFIICVTRQVRSLAHSLYWHIYTRLGSTRGTGSQTHSQVCRAEGLKPEPITTQYREALYMANDVKNRKKNFILYAGTTEEIRHNRHTVYTSYITGMIDTLIG